MLPPRAACGANSGHGIAAEDQSTATYVLQPLVRLCGCAMCAELPEPVNQDPLASTAPVTPLSDARHPLVRTQPAELLDLLLHTPQRRARIPAVDTGLAFPYDLL